MTNDELVDNIVGLMAYDMGCTDSGIHDEQLKEDCKRLVDERRKELTAVFTAYIHNWTDTRNGYDNGYCVSVWDIEDVAKFIAYLGDEFNWDCR